MEMKRLLGAALALGLIWLRHRLFVFDGLGNVAMAGAMFLQFAGYQLILSQNQPKGISWGLEVSQWGWFSSP